MEWEMQGNVLVPKSESVPMCAFVDEAYLLGQTGFLQAAIVVPQDIYTQQLVPRSKELLTKLGKEAKEFKGSSIKAGNANIYLEFLQGFINVAAQLGEVAPVYSIIAIDSADVYSSDPFAAINNNVTGAFANLGITDEEHLAAEFSRQILWLHVHFPFVTKNGFGNSLVLCFDNKHRYAQRMQALRAFTGPRLNAPTFWQLEKAFRSFANTLFQHLTPKIAMPQIERFRFQWSSVEFGLQAADLLCHLTLNAVRHGMGIVNDSTTLKTDLLKKVVPSFALLDDLKVDLVVGKDAEGKDDVRCVNPKLRSRVQLLPA